MVVLFVCGSAQRHLGSEAFPCGTPFLSSS